MANELIYEGKKYPLDIWITQAAYAREYNLKLATVSQWVKRAINNEGEQKIDYLEVPELSLTLVKKL